MGLFGGFKAKFKSNKAIKSKKNEVVCVKYKIFSEFDEPQSSTSSFVQNSTTQVNVGKNDVIKQKRPLPTKPEMKNVFPNGIARKLSIENGNVISASNEMKTSNDQQMITKQINNITISNANATVSDTSNISKPLPLQISDSYPMPKSVKKQAPQKPEINETIIREKYENDVRTVEPAIPHILADNSSASTAVMEDLEENENIYAEYQDHSYDKHNFKVHIVNHNEERDFSEEEEELNTDSESETNEYKVSLPSSPLEVSSQAASIFFGDDSEPEVIRPRKIEMEDDNTSHGSSASA